MKGRLGAVIRFACLRRSQRWRWFDAGMGDWGDISDIDSESCITPFVRRALGRQGQKRKHDEGKEVEESKQFADESSKDSNEEEEGSSSEADEMAAALDAELNDFM
ncbi:unnamed protein product [Pleuronectes platessa]|uniref:FCP1-like phosphatase C-terminal domain-containing protein n=1 Tax=Pleuronectes platessa TaxID=8262 RepID=A0A9N7YSZ6_PLEPL|nr:unnamed protein product [Pleuronectes platessa]